MYDFEQLVPDIEHVFTEDRLNIVGNRIHSLAHFLVVKTEMTLLLLKEIEAKPYDRSDFQNLRLYHLFEKTPIHVYIIAIMKCFFNL